MDVKILFNFISCLIINYIFFWYFLTKFSISIKLRTVILLIIMVSASTAIINQLNQPFLNLIFTFISLMIIKSRIFKLNIFFNLKDDIILFFIIVFLDSLCYFIVGLFISDNSLLTINYFRICSSSILLVFFYSIVNKLFNDSKLNKVPKGELLIFFLITLFSILLIYIFSLEYDYIELPTHKFFTIFIIVGLIFVDIIVFHYLEYINTLNEIKEQKLLEEQQKEISERYYDNLKVQYHNTRQLIHDFKNHLQMIDIAYTQKNYSLAKKLINLYCIESSNSILLLETNSEILNIILSDKIKTAKKLGINLCFNMEANINLDFINELDMITIFANLIDNAIEATNLLNNKIDKNILLNIYEVNEMLIILIENSCKNTLNYKNSKLISTKNGHKGIGFSNVEKTIKKYKGTADIEIKNSKCTVLLSLPKIVSEKSE